MARRVNGSQPSLSPSDHRWSSSTKTPITRPPSTSSFRTPIPLSVKSVLLHNWWLIRPEGKGLGVSGFETRGNLGLRIFSSGAIAKRLDAITLETEDGIKVELIGTINQSETHQNGFPFEVCSKFLLGFPYHWESYATESYVGKSKGKDATKSDSFDFNMPANSSDPISMDDIPVNRIRDLIMSPFGRFGDHIEGSILTDILGRVSNNVSKCTPIPINSELINGNPNESVNSAHYCSPSNHKKSKAESRCTSSEGNSETKHISISQRIMDDNPKISVGMHTPSTRIFTRSMTRSKNHGSQQEENILDSFLKCKTDNQLTSSEHEIQSGDDFQKKSKTNHSSKISSKHIEYAEVSVPEDHGMVTTSEVNGTNTDVISKHGDHFKKKPKTNHSSKSSSKHIEYPEVSTPKDHGMVATSEVKGMKTDIISKNGDHFKKKPKTNHSSKSSSRHIEYSEVSTPEGHGMVATSEVNGMNTDVISKNGDHFKIKLKTNHSSKSSSSHIKYSEVSTPEGHGMVAMSELNEMSTDVIPRQGDQLHKKPKTNHSSKSSSKQIKYVEVSMPEGQVERAVWRSSARLKNQNKDTNQGY